MVFSLLSVDCLFAGQNKRFVIGRQSREDIILCMSRCSCKTASAAAAAAAVAAPHSSSPTMPCATAAASSVAPTHRAKKK